MYIYLFLLFNIALEFVVAYVVGHGLIEKCTAFLYYYVLIFPP